MGEAPELPQAPPPESRVSRLLARRWAVPLVIAGAVALFALACITPDLVAGWQLSRERAAIRARGEPATLAELAPEMPPDDENAAVLLVEAFKLIDAASASEPGAWWDFAFEKGHPRRADAEAALKLHAKAMAVAREALKRPRCVFDLDYSKGAALRIPRLRGSRHLTRLFAAESLLRALDGRGPEAADSVAQVFLVARAAGQVPLLLSKIVCTAIAANGFEAAREIEATGVLGDEERRMLIGHVAALDFAKAATEGFVSERVFTVDGWDDVADMLPGGSPARGGWLSRLFAGGRMRLSRGEKVRAMRLSTAIVEASRLPPWHARPIIGERYRELWKILPWTEQIDTFDDEPWKRYYVPFMRAMATRDAAVLGLSCELFRSAKGRYPATLDELAPKFLKEIPPDPFTGKPFRYELHDGGRAFIAYSVGENLKDDSGAGREGHAEKDDISWEGRSREPAKPGAAPGPPE